jgi:hypothetical protein
MNYKRLRSACNLTPELFQRFAKQASRRSMSVLRRLKTATGHCLHGLRLRLALGEGPVIALIS